jgi:RNA-directed DNA polymerase
MNEMIYPSPKRILSSRNLRLTWCNSKDSKGRGGAPGVDGILARSFGANVEQHVRRIAAECSNGEFRFSKLRPKPFPKGNGKFRIICVPTIEDRLVQRTILYYLTAKSDLLGVLNPNSFGVQKGKEQGTHGAIETAIRRRQARPYVLKTDISKFFDNIPREYLLGEIRHRLRRRSVVPLLEKVVGCEIATNSEAKKTLLEGCGIETGKGLRQGMPLSPLLSNVVLRNFDSKLARLGKDYIRYVDDLIVFERDEAECHRTKEVIEKELDKIGLAIPGIGQTNSKTEIIGPSDEVIFLGLSIYQQKNGMYAKRIPQDAFDKIEETLDKEVSFSNFELRGHWTSRNFPKYVNWFENMKAGFRAAYADANNLEHFMDVVAQLIEKSKRRVLEEAVGEDLLEKISPKAQRFIGIG